MEFSIRAIVEVLGFPREHVDEVMKRVMEKLKAEEGMTVKNEKVMPAEPIKQQMFSSFADVEVRISDLGKLNYFCFHYLPSSVEILDQETVNFSVQDFTNYLNDILAAVHQYNLLLSNLRAEVDVLKGKQSQEVDQGL